MFHYLTFADFFDCAQKITCLKNKLQNDDGLQSIKGTCYLQMDEMNKHIAYFCLFLISILYIQSIKTLEQVDISGVLVFLSPLISISSLHCWNPPCPNCWILLSYFCRIVLGTGFYHYFYLILYYILLLYMNDFFLKINETLLIKKVKPTLMNPNGQSAPLRLGLIEGWVRFLIRFCFLDSAGRLYKYANFFYFVFFS